MKNLCFLFVAFLFLHLTTFAQWTQLADIPTARCFTSSCTIDSNIYVIGGIVSTSSTGPSVGTMEVYDPILDSWDTTKTDMPTSRVEFGACAVNGKIYAIGGATNHGASPFGIVEEYDPSTGNWTTKTPMPTPPRKGAAYGVIDNKIYVAGGTEVANFTASNKLEVYDPVTDTWIDTLDTMDYAIYSPTGAVINDKFYVIGGLLGFSPWTGQKIVQMYDPITDQWSRVADLDSGRVGHTTNGVAGYIYAIGGDRQPPIIRNVEEYDPSSNTWTVIEQTPFVKTGHTASVFMNKIYLISGSTTSLIGGFTQDSTVYSFDPSYFQDTLHVPADYTTIQAAIDAANNGDVVLVAEDTYYENINYKGKAITVASHFLIDGNETHIENTIIDGSQPPHPDTASVVYFTSGEGTNSLLKGFTITGGTGVKSKYFSVDSRVAGGIFIYNSSARIENNIIENNNLNSSLRTWGGGILVFDEFNNDILIMNNTIRNNICNSTIGAVGGGIVIQINGYLSLSNNTIVNNSITGSWASGGGIDCWGPINEVYIISNLIKGNSVQTSGAYGGGGIDIYNCTTETPVLENNIIVDNYSSYNGGGIFIDVELDEKPMKFGMVETSSTTVSENTQDPISLVNNTIINNTAATGGGGIWTYEMTPNILNSIFWGNTAPYYPQIAGNVNVTYSDVEGGWTGVGNINVNPSFSDTLFHLADSSQCIGAGIDSLDIGGVMYYCPPFCYYGSPRPNPSGSMPDIGACESPLADPINSVENDLMQIPDDYSLAQNYPNPFNPATTIMYGITERTFVELKIYDILGREVISLVNEEQDAGYYKTHFNASRLASGIYFYRLQAGSFVETKKMVLMK